MITINRTLNKIPSYTWNWLKMNSTKVEFSSDLKGTIKPSISKIPEGVTFEENGKRTAMSLPSLTTGMGSELDIFLQEQETTPSILTIDRGKKITTPIIFHFDFKTKTASVYEHVIRALDNSDITVIMDFTSPEKASGFSAVQTKIYCSRNAHVHLIKVQLLGNDFVQLDDTGCICEDNASIDITQIELGGNKIYAGIGALLSGTRSSFNCDTAYLCRKENLLDLNYIVNQTGRKTKSTLEAVGILNDKGQKTYKGTINLKKGCCGSTGNEIEDTLILNPDVINRTIPVILCDEEDVEGSHGATIGSLSDDVLFYINSRGMNKKAAEKLVSKGKIMSKASLIPDSKIVEKIAKYTSEAFIDD